MQFVCVFSCHKTPGDGSCGARQGRSLARVSLIKCEEAKCDSGEEEKPFREQQPWQHLGFRRFPADLDVLTGQISVPPPERRSAVDVGASFLTPVPRYRDKDAL